MSDEPENGNGNRATVAMVLREVENLAKLTGAHFDTVNVKLDSNAEAVVTLGARLTEDERELRALSLGHVTLRDAFDRHVKDTEKRVADQIADARIGRVNWWQFVPSVIALLIALAAIFLH